jgi:hypothetical protein
MFASVVLHGLGPVVHQVLIDVIGVNQRLAGVVGEQTLGKPSDDLLWVAAGLQGYSAFYGLPSWPHQVHVTDPKCER